MSLLLDNPRRDSKRKARETVISSGGCLDAEKRCLRFQKFAGVLWADRDVCGGVEGHARGVSEQPLTPALNRGQLLKPRHSRYRVRSAHYSSRRTGRSNSRRCWGSLTKHYGAWEDGLQTGEGSTHGFLDARARSGIARLMADRDVHEGHCQASRLHQELDCLEIADTQPNTASRDELPWPGKKIHQPVCCRRLQDALLLEMPQAV